MLRRLENFDKLIKILPKNDPRKEINGVLIESTSFGDKTRFVATDGHSMGLLDFHSILKDPTDIPPLTYIIPTESAKIIFALSKKNGFTMKFLGSGSIEVCTRLGDHLIIDLQTVKYPDYNKIITQDKPSDIRLKINRDYITQCGSFAEILIPNPIMHEGAFIYTPAKIKTTNGVFVIMPLRG